MKSHLRLYSITAPEKCAVLSVDYFYPFGERTVAWASFERLADGTVLYSLRAAVSWSTTRGTAPTTREAIERLTALVEETYGPVEHPIEFFSDGLDNMGLSFALGVDAGFAQE